MFESISTLILAAGKGTRMRSEQAKVLHPLAGLPLLAHPIHTVRSMGIKEVILVIGHQAEQVKQDMQRRFGKTDLHYAMQTEQLGTAHAVMSAQSLLQNSQSEILILSGDVPLLTAQSLEVFIQKKLETQAVVSLLSFITPTPTGYGRIVRDAQGKFIQIREHKDCSEEQKKIKECNSGIYLVDRDFLLDSLGKISTNNQQKEYYLTDIVEIAVKQGQTTLAHPISDPIEVSGINDRYQLAQLEEAWLQKQRQHWMLQGITMHLPQSIYFEHGVTFGQDCEIGSHCAFVGKTQIGKHCKIGTGSYIENASIADNTVVPPHSKIIHPA